MGACSSKPTKAIIVNPDAVMPAVDDEENNPAAAPATAAPAAAAAAAPAPAAAPAAAPPADESDEPLIHKAPLAPGEQAFVLVVPETAEEGSRLSISLPGIEEKIVVTVPSGATPGRSMSFTIKNLPDAKEAGAACKLQAVSRGRAARTTYMPKGHAAPPHEEAPPQKGVYTPRGVAAAGASASGSPGHAHDPALYPSLSPSQLGEAPPITYRPKGHAAPPHEESPTAADRSPMYEAAANLGTSVGTSVMSVGRGLSRMATAGADALSLGGSPVPSAEATAEAEQLKKERLAMLSGP